MHSGNARSTLIDHVIGAFPREGLSAALASTHRAGFGPHTRVLDGARSDAMLQLERAGLQVVEGSEPPRDALLIVVTAPGRTAIVAGLFEQLGAEFVRFAGRRASGAALAEPLGPAAPDIRIGDESVVIADA